MSDARVLETDHLMSVSEATGKGVSALARNAAQGVATVLMRGSVPLAAVVPMEAYYAYMARLERRPRICNNADQHLPECDCGSRR